MLAVDRAIIGVPFDQPDQPDQPEEAVVQPMPETAVIRDELGQALNPEVQPSLIEGPYTVFGLDPKADSLDRHAYRPMDMYRWIYKLMQNPTPIRFIVADTGLEINIFTRLRKTAPLTTPDSELKAEAKNTARLIGIKEILFIEAMQNRILRKKGEPSPMDREPDGVDWRVTIDDAAVIRNLLSRWTNPKAARRRFQKKSIHLMSDVLGDNRVLPVKCEALSTIISNDTALAKMFLECVPDMIIRKALSTKKQAVETELEEGHLPIRPEIIELFKYAVTQVIVTLFSGTKYGHGGEEIYDKLTTYVFENYGKELGVNPKNHPKFVYPKVELLDGTNTYRSVPTTVTDRSGVFSIARTFDREHEADAQFTQTYFNHPETPLPFHDFSFDLRESGVEDEMNFQDMEWVPIYMHFFELIEASTAITRAEKNLIRDAEIGKLMRESITAMSQNYLGKMAIQASNLREVDLSTTQSLREILRISTMLHANDPSVTCYEPIKDLVQFFLSHFHSA